MIKLCLQFGEREIHANQMNEIKKIYFKKIEPKTC